MSNSEKFKIEQAEKTLRTIEKSYDALKLYCVLDSRYGGQGNELEMLEDMIMNFNIEIDTMKNELYHGTPVEPKKEIMYGEMMDSFYTSNKFD